RPRIARRSAARRALRDRSAARRRTARTETRSQVAPFAGADAIALLDRNHEYAAVADLAGARRLNDRGHRFVDEVVGDDDLDFHFWQQADVVLLAAIDRGVALLLAVAADLGDGHSREADAPQRLLHVVDLVGAHDGLDQFHLTTPACDGDPRSARR